MRKLVRILVASTFAALLMIGNPTSSTAADCPDSWGITAPQLNVTSQTTPVTFGGKSIPVSGTSTLNEKVYKSSLPSPMKNMRGDIFVKNVNPSFLGSIAISKLSALGGNAAVTTSYISSTKSIYQGLVDGFFRGGEPSWILRWLGISNDSSVKYHLQIDVQGCPSFGLDSNAYTFNDLPTSEYGFDKFFSDFYGANTSGNAFTYLQVSALRALIQNNINTLQKTRTGQNSSLISMHDAGIGGEIPYMFVGMSPGGCIDAQNPNSIPPFGPISVIVHSKPCTVGLIAEAKDLASAPPILVSTFQILPDSSLLSNIPNNQSTSNNKIATKDAPSKTIIQNWSCIKGKKVLNFSGSVKQCPNGFKFKK